MTRSAVDRAAHLFGRRDDEPDDDDDGNGIFAMSIRVPSHIACKISVMAEQVRLSRYEMTNMIIEAGLDAILQTIPDEAHAEIDHRFESEIGNFIN